MLDKRQFSVYASRRHMPPKDELHCTWSVTLVTSFNSEIASGFALMHIYCDT